MYIDSDKKLKLKGGVKMLIKTESGRNAMVSQREKLSNKYNKLIDEGKEDTDEFKRVQEELLQVNNDIIVYDFRYIGR